MVRSWCWKRRAFEFVCCRLAAKIDGVESAAASIELSIEAAEGGFDLCIAGELAALGLGEAFEHGRKMRRVDLLGLAAACSELQHGAGDLVLAVGGQATHGLECLFEKLGHEQEFKRSLLDRQSRHNLHLAPLAGRGRRAKRVG